MLSSTTIVLQDLKGSVCHSCAGNAVKYFGAVICGVFSSSQQSGFMPVEPGLIVSFSNPASAGTGPDGAKSQSTSAFIAPGKDE